MDLTKTADALKKRGYEVSCFSTGAEAAAYLNGKIDGMTVGFGDSETLLQMHLFEMLQTHNDVYHPKYPREGKNFYSTAKDCLLTGQAIGLPALCMDIRKCILSSAGIKSVPRWRRRRSGPGMWRLL